MGDANVPPYQLDTTEWVLPNRKSFVDWSNKTFSKLRAKGKALNLFDHQLFIREYLKNDSPYRGLLLYHGLGSGKTCTSISAVEGMMSGDRKVHVFLPASLETNYIGEIRKCGHSSYTVKSHWTFAPSDANNVTNPEMKKVVARNGGVWSSNLQRPSNFDSLPETKQRQILDQVNALVKTTYKFHHYNGMTMDRIRTLKSHDGYFDNSVIVIDEVHNFISPVIGNGKMTKELYKLVMDAKDCKLILLSGTPMINRPIELAYLLNLVRGPIDVYEIPFSIAGKTTMDALNGALQAHPAVDFADSSASSKTVKLQLIPNGFKKTDEYTVVRAKSSSYSSDAAKLNAIAKAMTKYAKLDIESSTINRYYALPTDEDEFKELFLDSNGSMINGELFMRRILGTVSHFNKMDLTIYPKTNEIKVELCEMSDNQFKQYLEARKDERKMERKSTNAAAARGKKQPETGVYKAFSRALCHFAFPEGIKRPFPSKMDILNEMDDMDQDQEALADEVRSEIPDKKKRLLAYKAALQTALDKLSSTPKLLVARKKTPSLKDLSPKYERLVRNLAKSEGSSIIYSQFRSVEGIKLISMVLDAHGMNQFRVKKEAGAWIVDVPEFDDMEPKQQKRAIRDWWESSKYAVFNEDKQEVEVLLSVFNWDVEKIPSKILKTLESVYGEDVNNLHGEVVNILMITKSGAEGITTKNVRQVHVMEPYWNKIRMDQVIGRAVRAGSHLALPENEREVDVFVYISKFTAQQIETETAIRLADRGETSDEAIYETAARKAYLMSQFMNLLKRASVDCGFHGEERCMSFPEGDGPHERTFVLDIVNELKDVDMKKMVNVRRESLQKVTIRGIDFWYHVEKGLLIHYDMFSKFKEVVVVGKLESIGTDQWRAQVLNKYARWDDAASDGEGGSSDDDSDAGAGSDSEPGSDSSASESGSDSEPGSDSSDSDTSSDSDS
jgi:hypothetical protein